MRLIDADALEKQFRKEANTTACLDNRTYWSEALISVAEDVADAPTVDAVERKRGRWIKNEGKYGWHCSECKEVNHYAYVWNSETGKNDFQDRYCPNCGAKMDEVNE